MKAVAKYGYKITLKNGYTFDRRESYFKAYIHHFYELKKHAVGVMRFICKLQLNGIYGYFGRGLDLLKCQIVTTRELKEYLSSRIIHNLIRVTKDIYILLLSNLNHKNLDELNITTDNSNNSQFTSKTKSKVAIAAAVTANARIHMIDLKMKLYELGINVYYSDTDSVFTEKPIPKHFISKELGDLKDELNGGVIAKVYFLGIKQYGYIVNNVDGTTTTKSVFAGVSPNSLTFDEVVDLANGKTLTKIRDIKF